MNASPRRNTIGGLIDILDISAICQISDYEDAAHNLMSHEGIRKVQFKDVKRWKKKVSQRAPGPSYFLNAPIYFPQYISFF